MVLLIGLAFPNLALTTRNARKEYQSAIPMSSEEIKVANECISLTGSMNSPWFQGLERTETESGVSFHRSKILVSNFPEVLAVEIWAKPHVCNSWKPRLNEQIVSLVESLSFECFSKHGLEFKPIKIISIARQRFAKANEWLFLVQIRTAEIPLDDHIVFTVHGTSTDENILGRFSGQL